VRAFADLHCHSSASFDCLSRPEEVVRAAAARGLTHLAITDHDRIDGALAGRQAAPPELHVIVGEEIRTSDGDLIALFLDEAVPSGLTARQTIARVRAQGGLVGIPHPFDRFRGSLLRESALLGIVDEVDWIETYNARLVGGGNDRAAELARERGIPGVAVSDAHSIMEVAVAYTSLEGDPSSPEGLRAALATAQLVPGRASFVVRALTPVAKLVQRLRGNRRPAPAR
jgi:hypothetical protein